MKIVIGIFLLIVGLACVVIYMYLTELQKQKNVPARVIQSKKQGSNRPASSTVIPQNPESRDIARLVVQADSEGAARIIRKWLREK